MRPDQLQLLIEITSCLLLERDLGLQRVKTLNCPTYKPNPRYQRIGGSKKYAKTIDYPIKNFGILQKYNKFSAHSIFLNIFKVFFFS